MATEHIPVPKLAGELIAASAKAVDSVRKGRPSSYSEAIAEHVLERMECYGESLKHICANLEQHGLQKVSDASVRRWANQNVSGYSSRFARACQLRTHVWADQVVEIADDTQGKDSNSINSARLRIDTRKFLMQVLNPQYSDKRQVEMTGADGGPIEVVDPTELARSMLAVISALEQNSST